MSNQLSPPQNPQEMLLYMRDYAVNGNIIDRTWYKIFRWKKTNKRPEGKPHREAIELLADIFYWYKPTEVVDECGNVTLKKKFYEDILQRSYKQLEESLGLTHDEAQSAFRTLEKFKVAKRVFRTITVDGKKYNNVMFIKFFPHVLKKLTNKYFKDTPKNVPPMPFKRQTPMPFKRQTNTKTSSTQTTLRDNVCEPPPDFPNPKQETLFSSKEENLEQSMNRFRLTPEMREKAVFLASIERLGTDLNTICYWAKKYSYERLKCVFIYSQGKSKENIGAYMRKILEGGIEVPNAEAIENQTFAKDFKEAMNWTELEIGDYYVKYGDGNGKEVPLRMNPHDFARIMMSKYESRGR